ncbi:MAG: hypothetical protein LQ352_002102 [Teloschistes flavicans]|nr:MAG: hypothetical protein LQ352_002102 [Teloschistes flavicans]
MRVDYWPCLLDCFNFPRPDFIDPTDPDPPNIPPPPGYPPRPPRPPGDNPPGPPPGPPGDGDNSNSQSNSQSSTESCTTQTVTDYWVSCSTITSGSSSCTTTSSSVVQGCSVTATTQTTATGSFCPLVTLDPNDDQGEDGDGTPEATPASGLQNTDATAAATSVDHSGGALQGPPQANATPPPAPPPSPPPPPGPAASCASRDAPVDVKLNTGNSFASYSKSDMDVLCQVACYGASKYPVHQTKDFEDSSTQTTVRLVFDASVPSGTETNFAFDQAGCYDGAYHRLVVPCDVWGGRLSSEGINFLVYAYRFPDDSDVEFNPPVPPRKRALDRD